jgi:Gpi18-like mannosyltransferase
MSGANPQSKAGKVCFCVLLFAITLYLFASIREIDQDLNRNSDSRTYFTKDAMHYYAIGEAFASGGFSMSCEKGSPYRQSLFPLVVAGILQATNDNLFAAKLINVAAIIVAAITLFLILRAYWRDSATAAIISILFVLDPFVVGRAGSPLRRYAVSWWHYALAALVSNDATDSNASDDCPTKPPLWFQSLRVLADRRN